MLLLVDGNLVLLQPSTSETGDLKYDMRVISHDVEYYILMRDQFSFNSSPPADESLPSSPAAEVALKIYSTNQSLRDSLWTFCGKDLLAWGDVKDVLNREDVPSPIEMPLDFYPLSVLLNKGIVLGVEAESIQRRDVTFAILKFAIRVCHATYILGRFKDANVHSRHIYFCRIFYNIILFNRICLRHSHFPSISLIFHTLRTHLKFYSTMSWMTKWTMKA